MTARRPGNPDGLPPDELRRRLGSLDPMPSGVHVPPLSRERLEDIMATPTITTTETPRPERRRNRWYIAAAGVAVAALAVVGVAALNDGGGSGDSQVAAGPPLELSLGAGDALSSCMAFSVEELARAPMAFEGTVTAADGGTVEVTVDRWFKGGDATAVELLAPEGMEALIAGIDFVTGEQYLITAFDGTVNYCGFSGPATPELRAAFEQAFGSA
jgi:hypothetical protein